MLTMQKRPKSNLSRFMTTAVGALGALACAAGAHAQSSTEELEARIQALEAALSDLKGDLADAQAATPAEPVTPPGAWSAPRTLPGLTTPAAAPVEQAEPAVMPEAADQFIVRRTAEGNGFQMGATTVKYGGIIDLDVHSTRLEDGNDFANSSLNGSQNVARDFYIPGATPVGADGEDEADLDFTARASRFFFTTDTDVGENKIGTRLEFDFLVTNDGNERVSNSYTPRLRRGEFTYNNWMFGQSWSTFQILDSIPESASFLVASDGMVFIRQAQARYTRDIGGGQLQFAVENGNTTVSNTTGTGAARIVADDNALPDVVARYNRKGEWGSFSAAAIVRQLKFDSNEQAALPVVDDEIVGWGVNVGGKVNFERGDIRWQVAGGEGLGRYIGLNAANGVAIDENGDLDAISSVGGLIAARFETSPKSRVNVGVSALSVDNPTILEGTTFNESVQSVFANYMFDVAPKVTMGLEVLVGQREDETGADGQINRVTFSAKRFF